MAGAGEDKDVTFFPERSSEDPDRFYYSTAPIFSPNRSVPNPHAYGMINTLAFMSYLKVQVPGTFFTPFWKSAPNKKPSCKQK